MRVTSSSLVAMAFALGAVSGMLGAGCTESKVCGPDNCAGCCAGDQCFYGALISDEQCGRGGELCNRCSDGLACVSGACGTPPAVCNGVVCDTPPDDVCLSGSVLKTHPGTGTCLLNQCDYPSTEVTCGKGCVDGGCLSSAPCPSPCTQVPPNICVDFETAQIYNHTGLCNNGSCTYPSALIKCLYGCVESGGGASCRQTSCDAGCENPPAAMCLPSGGVRTFDAGGVCVEGMCQFRSTDGTCTANPPGCAPNGTDRRIYLASCDGGACVQTQYDLPCTGSWTTCNGNTPTNCSYTGACTGAGNCTVNCVNGTVCGGATPNCVGGQCVPAGPCDNTTCAANECKQQSGNTCLCIGPGGQNNQTCGKNGNFCQGCVANETCQQGSCAGPN